MALTIIEVENVRFTQLKNVAVGSHFQPVTVFGPDHGFFSGSKDHIAGGAHRIGAIIGDVQIQVTITIDIGQGESRCAIFSQQSAALRFDEMTFAVVNEKASAGPDPIDKQVQIAIAIDVSQNGSGGILALTTD